MYADISPCVLELECRTLLLLKVFSGQRRERAAIFCADGKSTVWRSLVYLLISSREADSEEVQFCDSLTINGIPNLILFLRFQAENTVAKIYYVIVVSAFPLSHLYSLQSL